MVSNAEEQLADLIDQPTFLNRSTSFPTIPGSPAVGKVLRRTSLDEAPQFYNVLIGEMSLVGPRQEAQIVALYRDQERRRLAIKPGLTGPMQINGRGDLSLAERLRLELDYISVTAQLLATFKIHSAPFQPFCGATGPIKRLII